MEADWEVEIGGDAPVIDACWDGFVDLRFNPRMDSSLPPDTYRKRAHGLAESANLPGLAEALAQLNGLHSPVWTSKCDVWPVPDAADIDAGELDAPQEDATFAWACYIDLVPRIGSWSSAAGGKNLGRGFVTGHDWQVWVSTQTHRADKADEINWASAPAENPVSWVGRGFIPGVKATESTRPLGPEACFPPISPEFRGLSATHSADAAIHACKVWREQLRAVPLTHCRADLIVRQAAIAPEIMDHGVTAYLTACGRTSEEANAALARALQAFANTLCPDSTVE